MFDEEQVVSVKWNNANKKSYIDKGYIFTKIGNSFLIKAQDLPPFSDTKITVICDYCGKEYHPSYKNYKHNKNKGTCDCCNNCKYIKIKETNKERYGVEWFTLTKDFVDKTKKSCIDKYGVENPSQIDWVKDKKIKTNQLKYGCDWFVQSKDFQIFCEENFGVSNPMKSQEIMDKAAVSLYKNGNTPVSKIEQKIYEMLVEIYGKEKCYQSFPCRKFSMDCMLDLGETKIDVEYDGWYWHKTRQDYDRRRDAVLKTCGYKVLRIQSYNQLPSKQQIIEAVDYLQHTNSRHYYIKLDV